MAKLTFNAQMKRRFQTITSNYQKANEYVHETAMMIARHAKEHGDCSSAQGLVMALPASSRREMLILWFATYTPIVVKNSKDFESKMHKDNSKLYKPFDLEAADADPFYEIAKRNKESEPKDFEALIAMVAGLSKRIEKMANSGDIKDADNASALNLANQLSSIQFKRVKASTANDEKAMEAA